MTLNENMEKEPHEDLQDFLASILAYRYVLFILILA
jgi:hypothetical protein